MDFEDVLYQPNEAWGNWSGYIPESQIEETMQELEKVFGEPVSLDDCTRLDIVRQIDDETALYEGRWAHDGGWRNARREGVLIRFDGTEYIFVRNYYNADSYQEED